MTSSPQQASASDDAEEGDTRSRLRLDDSAEDRRVTMPKMILDDDLGE